MKGNTMGDPWVETVQQWLLDTYDSDAIFGTGSGALTTATGNTGWPTMYALTRALQHELGIQALSNTFGPGTMSALTSFGTIGSTTSHTNILKILVGAMYCKGYDGGGGSLDGVWRSATATGIKKLQKNIGVAETGTVSPKLFKALLNMDAYVVVGHGSQEVREVQQWMNATYLDRSWFSIIPTDGSYSRDVQRMLIYAIQVELAVPGANGNYGPGTRNAVKAKTPIYIGDTDTTGKKWVRLFQAALRFNKYNVDFTGTYIREDSDTVKRFQSFACLPITGNGDYQTWSSLLVSSGDPTRSGQAADCVTTITPERAATLVADGRLVVGRYISTGAKIIQPGELQTFADAGLRVFPIYQTSGNSVAYFTEEKGFEDGVQAVWNAQKYGFKNNTVIYFAVDFDALGTEITSRVIPYFQGVQRAMGQLMNKYVVGVYGTRNVCTQLAERGLAEKSFVSGMSTGFSGNLGFRLPNNWAFDQVATITLGTGNGAIEIDNDIYSGRDLGHGPIDPADIDAYVGQDPQDAGLSPTAVTLADFMVPGWSGGGKCRVEVRYSQGWCWFRYNGGVGGHTNPTMRLKKQDVTLLEGRDILPSELWSNCSPRLSPGTHFSFVYLPMGSKMEEHVCDCVAPAY